MMLLDEKDFEKALLNFFLISLLENEEKKILFSFFCSFTLFTGSYPRVLGGYSPMGN